MRLGVEKTLRRNIRIKDEDAVAYFPVAFTRKVFPDSVDSHTNSSSLVRKCYCSYLSSCFCVSTVDVVRLVNT